MKNFALFGLFLIALLSLPIVFSETTVHDERTTLTHASIVIETDDPNWSLKLLGLDESRLKDVKIVELLDLVVVKTKQEMRSVPCNGKKAVDLNGSVPVCTEYVSVPYDTIVTFELPFSLIKTKPDIKDADRDIISRNKSIVNESKIEFNPQSVFIPLGETRKFKVTWRNDLTNSNWSNIGAWSINPSEWWDLNSSVRLPINLPTPHDEYTTDNTIELRNINRFDLNASGDTSCVDNNRLAVVWQNNGVETELDVDIIGNCAVQDVNIFFKSQFDIPSATSFTSTDLNGYYIYILDQNRINPPRDETAVYTFYDNFDDGSVADWEFNTDYPVYSPPKLIFDANSNYSVSAPYSASFFFYPIGGETSSVNIAYAGHSTGANQRYNYATWFRSTRNRGVFGSNNRSGVWGGSTEGVGFGVTYDGNSIVNFGTADVNTWYMFELQVGTGDINAVVLDESFDSVASGTKITDVGVDANSNTSIDVSSMTGAGQTWFDNYRVWVAYDGESLLGAREFPIIASFIVTGSESLDPENGVNSVPRTFVNTSQPIDANFTWYVNNISSSSDVNYTHNFTVYGDYNVSLVMNSGGIVTQVDANVHIAEYPQNVSFVPTTATVGIAQDYNASGDSNSGIVQWYWNFPNPDTNYLGTPANHTFNTGGNQTVCLTAQDNDDLNKTTCEIVTLGGINFSVSGTGILDPENGIITANRFFTNESAPIMGSDFNWFIDSVLVSTDVNLNYNFTYMADYNVSLIMDDSGTIRQLDANVSILEYPQNVAFTPIVTQRNVLTQFTSTVDVNNAVVQTYWNFPNPDTNYLGNPTTHTFSTGGYKDVCVTTQSDFDLNKTACQSISVTDVNFTVTGSGILNPDEGITSTTRQFVNGSLPIDANYTWRINGGVVSTAYDYNHSFTINGDYNVSLLQDSRGQLSQFDVNVTILEYPQNIDFTPLVAQINVLTAFTGTADSNSGVAQWYWFFSNPDTNYLGNPVNHTFNTSGNQVGCLTVQDNDDLNSSICKTIGGVDVNFVIEGNTILDPEKGITSLAISFLNYSYPSTAGFTWLINSLQVSTDTNLTYDFTTIGDYNITLLMDFNGTIIQEDQNLTITEYPQGINFTPKSARIGTATQFTATSDSNVTQWYWNFSSPDTNYVGVQATHTFNNVAPYSICLTAQEDINRTICEQSYSKISILPPINIIDSNVIIPYDITFISPYSASYTGLNTDINILTFLSSQNFYFSIDANTAEYYILNSLVVAGDTNSTTFYQPYLTPISDEVLEVMVYTIDNQQNRASLPGIRMESYTVIGGETVLVESKESDGTGVGLLHFEVGREYTIVFYEGDEQKLSIAIIPSAPNLFVYIDTGIVSIFDSVESIQINWYPSGVNVVPDVNSVLTLTQIVSPIATIIGDVNVVVRQGSSLVYTELINDLNSSVDVNVSYDFNVSSLNQNLPLRVTLQIYDVNGVLLIDSSATYSFVNVPYWSDTIGYLRVGFGVLFLTIVMLLVSLVIVWYIIKGRVGENNNWIFIIPVIITGIGVFVGFVPFIPWLLGVWFGLMIAIWRLRD